MYSILLDANMLVRRREEHKLLYKHIMSIEKYEKQYKMLEIAYQNILEVIENNRKVLIQEVSKAFPTNSTHLEALFAVIENTCLFGDMLLHIPDVSYKILNRQKNWKYIIDWSLDYTSNDEFEVLDQITSRMLMLLYEEINPDERSADYINPYSRKKSDVFDSKTKKTKKRKILKKGPQLTSRNEL